MAQPDLKEREPLVMTRNFAVAPDKVWRAWIDPAAIRIWFGQSDTAEALITVRFNPVAGGTELDFTLDPVVDARERDAWRADFKRLALLLQEK